MFMATRCHLLENEIRGRVDEGRHIVTDESAVFVCPFGFMSIVSEIAMSVEHSQKSRTAFVETVLGN